MKKIPPIGFLQGRLTPSNGKGIQFFPFENWESEFEIASKIGFNIIELLVKRDSYEKNPLWVDEGIKKISELKRECNIETLSVHGFYDRTQNYPEVITKIIQNANHVGAKTVLISFFNEHVLLNEEDKAFARTQLEKPLQVATELGIYLGIETEIPAKELGEFLDSFNSNNIKVYYDIGNMVSLGVDVVEEIKFFSERICGVHVKDRKLHDKSVPIGDGDTDFLSVFTALKDIGYQGTYIMQGARSEGVDDIKLNQSYLKYTRNLLEQVYT